MNVWLVDNLISLVVSLVFFFEGSDGLWEGESWFLCQLLACVAQGGHCNKGGMLAAHGLWHVLPGSPAPVPSPLTNIKLHLTCFGNHVA